MTAASLAAIIALVLVNGFFVAAEFALVSARPERISERPSRSRRLVERQMNRLDEYLAACQLGITIASLALGALGEPTLAALFEPALGRIGASVAAIGSTVLALLVMTALHITVGEQAPKSFAIGSAERVSSICAAPLEVFARVLRPLVVLLNKTANGIVRLFGGTPTTSHADSASLEELRRLIGTVASSGELSRTDRQILEGVFTLDERTASEVMTPRHRVAWVCEDDAVEQALRTSLSSGHSRLPLLDEDEEDLLGVVYARELTEAVLEGHGADTVASYRHEILVAPRTQRLDVLLSRMQAERATICAVLDEYGRLDGVVTVEDIVEEIVGEIEDEDDSPAAVRRLRTGRGLVARGDTPLVDLRGFDVDLGEAASDSVGGLVQERLDRIPKPGDLVEANGNVVRVLSMEGRRVKRVLVLPDAVADEEEGPSGEEPEA